MYARFNPAFPTSIIKRLDEVIAQGGDIELDETGGDPSYITIPVGAVEGTGGTSQSAGTITALNAKGEKLAEVETFAISGFASIIFSKESVVGEVQDIISDIYEITLENAAVNKELTVSLAYDRDKMGDDYNMVNIRRLNETTGEWEVVEGVVTIDSVNGTASVEVSQFSKFAVFYGIPQEQTGPDAYTGNKFRMYNLPNPFDLKEKVVTLKNQGSLSAQQTVQGTVIKYYLPSSYGSDAQVKITIYNIAGELVRTIDDGTRNGGYIYFTEWDGKNEEGEKCASGVYFAIAKINDKVATDKPLKMAIIK